MQEWFLHNARIWLIRRSKKSIGDSLSIYMLFRSVWDDDIDDSDVWSSLEHQHSGICAFDEWNEGVLRSDRDAIVRTGFPRRIL